jgi:coenzyme F420-0:L-glutamate ligase/coenzyme F420-1:gamma-L-glutamate ligase
LYALAIRTPILKQKDDLVTIILDSLESHKLELKEWDILAISSKAIATIEVRIVPLEKVFPSEEAKQVAHRHSLEPEFSELVLKEADEIYGGVYKAILTLKKGILTVNAGVDRKNAPAGYAALWPLNPQNVADKIRTEIKQQSGRIVGVVIVDSQLAPLRMGTRGMALAVSGFRPVEDCRGKKDLFQKPLLITRRSVGDDLASTAHLLMGETNQQTPVVLIRDAPVTFVDRVDAEEMKIPERECVYMHAFQSI